MQARRAGRAVSTSAALALAACLVLAPVIAAAQCDPPPPKAGSPWGVNASFNPMDDLPGNYPLMHQGGVQWVRMDFFWSDLEPHPGEYHWELVEPAVDRALQSGMSVLAAIFTTPPWARRAQASCSKNVDGSATPPSNPAYFASFAAAAAKHFRNKVGAWQIWDEANLCWAWDGNAQDFRQLILGPGFDALRANAHPTAMVGGPVVNGSDFDPWYTYQGADRRVLLRPFDFYSTSAFGTVAQVDAVLDAADVWNRCNVDSTWCTKDLLYLVAGYAFYEGPKPSTCSADPVADAGQATTDVMYHCIAVTNRCYWNFYWDTMQVAASCPDQPLLNADGSPKPKFCDVEQFLTGSRRPPC